MARVTQVMSKLENVTRATVARDARNKFPRRDKRNGEAKRPKHRH